MKIYFFRCDLRYLCLISFVFLTYFPTSSYGDKQMGSNSLKAVLMAEHSRKTHQDPRERRRHEESIEDLLLHVHDVGLYSSDSISFLATKRTARRPRFTYVHLEFREYQELSIPKSLHYGQPYRRRNVLY